MAAASPAPTLMEGPAEPAGPPRSRRGRALPHVTMALPAERRRAGVLLSLVLHVAVIALLAYDFVPQGVSHIARLEQGAGGPGPAGGGGGGNRGTGGSPPLEKITYVRVAQAPPPPAPVVVPPTPQPVVPPVIPPLATPQPQPQPVLPVPATTPLVPSTGVASAVPGVGGGTGGDGSGGSGPGSGGGVGSGIGTGRGSGTGPGTGGGTQANYPPSPIEMLLPPLPAPAKVRGSHIIAEFDIDETGRVVGFTFTETRDGDYNRKLRDVLRQYRFRPGTTPGGVPLRMKAQVAFDIP